MAVAVRITCICANADNHPKRTISPDVRRPMMDFGPMGASMHSTRAADPTKFSDPLAQCRTIGLWHFPHPTKPIARLGQNTHWSCCAPHRSIQKAAQTKVTCAAISRGSGAIDQTPIRTRAIQWALPPMSPLFARQNPALCDYSTACALSFCSGAQWVGCDLENRVGC